LARRYENEAFFVVLANNGISFGPVVAEQVLVHIWLVDQVEPNEGVSLTVAFQQHFDPKQPVFDIKDTRTWPSNIR